MQLAQPYAANRDLGLARSREEISGSSEVLRHSLARSVDPPELRAPRHVGAIAGLLKERCCSRRVLRDASTLIVQETEPRASVHGLSVAALSEQRDGASRIAFDALALLVDLAEARAPIANPTLARHVEQLGGMGLVPQDVFSLLELERERVAGGDVSRLAGVAQSFGLLIPRVACGQHKGGREGKGGWKPNWHPSATACQSRKFPEQR
jgi:hypothetical protein